MVDYQRKKKKEKLNNKKLKNKGFKTKLHINLELFDFLTGHFGLIFTSFFKRKFAEKAFMKKDSFRMTNSCIKNFVKKVI